jgi:hypothetical protein
MSIAIERTMGTTGAINVTSNPATTDTIPLGPSAGGLLYCVNTSTASAITVLWYANFAPDSADFQLTDASNTVTTTTIQPGRCCELPAELFGAPQVKIVAQTAGQTATLRVSLKG